MKLDLDMETFSLAKMCFLNTMLRIHKSRGCWRHSNKFLRIITNACIALTRKQLRWTSIRGTTWTLKLEMTMIQS